MKIKALIEIIKEDPADFAAASFSWCALFALVFIASGIL
jgi:hypothetical protein